MAIDPDAELNNLLAELKEKVFVRDLAYKMMAVKHSEYIEFLKKLYAAKNAYNQAVIYVKEHDTPFENFLDLFTLHQPNAPDPYGALLKYELLKKQELRLFVELAEADAEYNTALAAWEAVKAQIEARLNQMKEDDGEEAATETALTTLGFAELNTDEYPDPPALVENGEEQPSFSH